MSGFLLSVLLGAGLLFSCLVIETQSFCDNSSSLSCCSPSECYDLADDLQIEGTQSSFIESTIVLYNALEEWPNNSSLLALYGKLHLFYLSNYKLAKDAILDSLTIDDTASNLNCYLFAGWLYSTILYRDVDTADSYFNNAILLNGNNSSNFWPYFEYAAFLSHIADNYTKSQEYYQIAIDASGGAITSNPFISFFYGLLVKYHLDNETYGDYLIDSAISAAAYLPDIAATNMVFQSILLNSKNKHEEAMECCRFSVAIMNETLTSANLFCSDLTTCDSDGNDDNSDSDSGNQLNVEFGFIGLALLAVSLFGLAFAV